MKLTKADKEAFVRAVMDDVPIVDHNEEAASLVMAEVIANMPEKVKTVYEAHPEWIKREYISLPRYLRGMYGPVRSYTNASELSKELQERLDALAAAEKEQQRVRRELEQKVGAIINSCTTLKQAKERLPEFEKYLPAERGSFGTAQLPVVANLVTDLVNLGWPKTEEVAV